MLLTVIRVVAVSLLLCAPTVFAYGPPKSHTDLSGDPLPDGVAARLGTIRWRVEPLASSITYFPDGKSLVTGSPVVCVWDAATGLKRTELQFRYGTVYSVAVSPDGKLIVPCGTAWGGMGLNTITVWDAATGREVRQLVGHTNLVFAAAFSPDGRCLASASDDRTVRLWNVGTGKELRQYRGHTGWVQAVAFSRDGKLLVSAGKGGTVRVWDVETAKEVNRFAGPPGEIRSVALSPDGKLMAWGYEDRTLCFADLTTGKELRRLSLPHGYYPRVAFSPDGKTLACGAYELPIRLLDAATGAVAREFPDAAISDFAFSPDGKTLAGVGTDGTIRRWSVADGVLLPRGEGHTSPVAAVAFTADDQTVVSTGYDGTVRRWDVSTAKSVGAFSIDQPKPWWEAATVALTSDARLVGTSGPRIWDVATGSPVAAFAGNKPNGSVVAFSPDGRFVATVGPTARETGEIDGKNVVFNGDTPTRLMELASGKEIARVTEPTNARIVGLAVAPDGKHFAQAISGGSIREHGWVTLSDGAGKATRRLGDAAFRHYYCLAFSPDGKVLATSVGAFRNSGIELWDVATGDRVRQLSENIATCLTFTPDGKTLVGPRGPVIRFWDLGTGADRGQIDGLGTDVNCLTVSHDGKWLAAGCGDTTVLILPIDTRTAPKQK